MVDISLKTGNSLGRFQLLVPIGSGGMGRVWVAREETTRRLFAIKTTLAEEQTGGEFWNVLMDEARIAAQVRHRSVCAIHAFEVDEQRGVPYLVMDFSDGGSLHELLAASPDHRIDPVIAATVTLAICEGLQVAHDLKDELGAPLGVVHRDVSPQNILISSGGHVQLTDFGVAKARGRVHAATVTGEIKGKLSYMAPEQVTTRDVDRRADVFALGCVLYESTVGERPFHGDDAVATLYQLLEQPLVLPSSRLEGYPLGLQEIVVKALERNPALRYQSAEELATALSLWIATQGRLVTELDVVKLMSFALGPSIAERARRIAAAEQEIDSPPPSAPASEQTLAGSAASTPSSLEAGKVRRSKLKWSLGAGAIGGAALLLVLFGFRGGAGRGPERTTTVSPKAAVTATDVSVAAHPTEAERVMVTLRAEPARAVLFLDDGAALPNPFKLTVVKGGESHRVRAAAAGFDERVENVRFDADKDVLLTLTATPTGPAPRAPANKPKLTPMVAPVVSAEKVTMGDLPPVVKKPPRTLDSDNPFASH